MARYRLSELAAQDFESIYLFGVANFGPRQAEAYVAGMQDRFEQLAERPLSYPAVDHVRQGYRLAVYGSHAIYFRKIGEEVVVVRILRSQNIDAALME